MLHRGSLVQFVVPRTCRIVVLHRGAARGAARGTTLYLSQTVTLRYFKEEFKSSLGFGRKTSLAQRPCPGGEVEEKTGISPNH